MTFHPLRLVLLLLTMGAVAMSAARAQTGHDDDHDHAAEAGHEPRAVALSDAELEEFGIGIAEAGGGRIRSFVSLPGEVRPNDDRLAHIVPRYSGIVVEVHANIGDRVRRGDVLAVVESDDALTPYDLKTLIDGIVIAKHITRGEAVSRDKDTYLIADLSTVWVDLTVYPRDIRRVRVGQEASIFTGHTPAEAAGPISYITPVIDERTRTATARVVLPNPDGRWRPGMFVTALVPVESREVSVAVPRSAVHTMDGAEVVFVQTDAGFVPQPVVVGLEGEDQVEIVSGLEPGTPYVSVGGFTLKAEFGKHAFGDGHAH